MSEIAYYKSHVCDVLDTRGWTHGVMPRDSDCKHASTAPFSHECKETCDRGYGLTKIQIVQAAVLVGCDYCMRGVPYMVG